MATTINADQLFTDLIGETPRTYRFAEARLSKIWDEIPAEHGIVKRLMAALKSAHERGLADGAWSFSPTGDAFRQENGALWETCRTGRFNIASESGRWSSRSWSFDADLEVCVDDDGVESVYPADFVYPTGGARGTAVVGSRGSDDTTTFTGSCIAQFGAEILGRAVRHAWIDTLCTYPQPTEQPDWLAALAQLVESIATDAGDPSGAVAFARAVGDGLDGYEAKAVLSELGLRCGDLLADAIRAWMRNPRGDLRDAIDGHIPAAPGAASPRYDDFGELIAAAIHDVHMSAKVDDMSDAEVKALAEGIAASILGNPRGQQATADLEDDRSDQLAAIAEELTGYRVIVFQRYESADGNPVGYGLHLDYPRQGCSNLVAYLTV